MRCKQEYGFMRPELSGPPGPSLRYYGTRPREVEHSCLGYGTRLSSYMAPDLPKGEYASLNLVRRGPDPSMGEAHRTGPHGSTT